MLIEKNGSITLMLYAKMCIKLSLRKGASQKGFLLMILGLPFNRVTCWQGIQ